MSACAGKTDHTSSVNSDGGSGGEVASSDGSAGSINGEGGESPASGGGRGGTTEGPTDVCDGFGCFSAGGTAAAVCGRPFECNGAELSSCVDGETTPVERCVSAALCIRDAGVCRAPRCNAGELRCVGHSLVSCSDDEAGFATRAQCASAALCDAERGECLEPTCSAGDVRCAGSTLETCAADRTGFIAALDCGDPARCIEERGRCEVDDCSPGEFQCVDSVLLVCNDAGTSWELVETCTDSAVCDADAGKCQEPACNGESCAGVSDSLDGRLLTFPCADNPNNDDCARAGAYYAGELQPCDQGMLDVQLEHAIGGTPGVDYLAILHFYGVLGPKVYGNGLTRAAGSDRPDLDGGTPTSWASAAPNHPYAGSTYGTYEVRVRDENGSEVAVYYLNSDTQEGHYTILVDYEQAITIVGGGTVLVRAFDANCRAIKNCGTEPGYPCADKARSVDIAEANPQPPQGDPPALDQPGLGQSADHAGQWLLIDVVHVETL